MDPKDPQFEYGKPRNAFEEVWGAIYGNSGSDRSLSAMQKKQDEQKIKQFVNDVKLQKGEGWA